MQVLYKVRLCVYVHSHFGQKVFVLFIVWLKSRWSYIPTSLRSRREGEFFFLTRYELFIDVGKGTKNCSKYKLFGR